MEEKRDDKPGSCSREELPLEIEITMEEKVAVLNHKWILSEKAGYDVGWDFAFRDFFLNRSPRWRVKRLQDDFRRQKNEILKHKWYLSEKEGHDIGIEKAALDWIKSGYAEQWRNSTGEYGKKEEKK